MSLCVAVTLGDPAGIGPEVTERALMDFLPTASLQVLLVGPDNIVIPMAARLGDKVTAAPQASFHGPLGRPSASSGTAALAALDAAIALAQSGAIAAIVTAPISKHALAMAGSRDVGHTDILARALGEGPVAMSFFTERLRVVLATVHMPLKEIFQALTEERIVEVAVLMHTALRDRLRIAKPRLALAGLNPHAGEQGLLGDEEGLLLAPAAAAARKLGIALSDPIAADTVFNRAVAGEFDAVVALYHDQGLIPVKLLSFGAAVNVTLGLEVLRTSPDHGTAFDLVGTGKARAHGMLGALRAALQLLPLPKEKP